MKKINTLLYTLLAAVMTLAATGANAQSWNFTSSSSDEANLKADAANWTYDADNNRYSNVNPINGPLTANGQTLAFADGLTFNIAQADGLRIDIDKRISLNKANGTITIPGLTAGQVVTVEGTSSSKTTGRSITATNLTGTTGFGDQVTSSETLTATGTVGADGDVVITNPDGGFYLYSIKVQSQGEVTPPAPDYNDVALNTAKNQMRLTLGSEIKYYNTDDVKVAFDRAAGTVTVTPNAGTWQDVYTKTVSKIDFAAATEDTPSGDVTEGEVKITAYDGWNEAAYVEWEILDGASSYAVYAKGGSIGSEYKKIDYQLVRNYGSYGRADVLGLSAGTYSIKVVPVINDTEDESKASSVDNIEVIGHDRVGFAFANDKAPGAYNMDGTLKSNAVVIYITNSNKDNVSLDIVTSSKGSTTKSTGFQTILNSIKKGYDNRVFVFRLIGNVDVPGDADKGDICVDMGGKTTCPGITIEGVGKDAVANGWGIRVKNATSVEIRNLAFMNCHSSEGDNIGLQQGNNYVWVHHCDMFYGDAGSDADQVKGDGALDCKKSNYVTFSYNRFWDSGKSCLLSNGGDEYGYVISYHHNWFDHSDSRHPRIRCYNAHIFNNYFDGCAKYGVGASLGSSAFVENNYFRGTDNPILTKGQGTDSNDATFDDDAAGMVKAIGNIFAEKSSNFSYITQNDNTTSFDAYEASSRDEKVPSSYKSLVGGTTYNNFDTDPSIMYEYTPDDANEVVAVVTGKYGAGRLQHGDFQWSFDNATEDHNYDVIPELKSAVTNYKTTLKGIFDGENDETETTEPGGGEGGEQGGTEPGGDEGGEQGGGDTPVIEGTVTCSFIKDGTYSNVLSIVGNYSDSKGSMTINGTTYTWCLKMESATSITFTIDKPMTLNLYLDGKCTAKIDGEKNTGSNGVISVQLAAGSHEITKQDSCNLFLIELVPIE